GWWNADDAAKVQRLVAMLMQTPPLVSDAASAKRTIHIPLERLAAYGPVHRVLEAEARTGWIGERTQASELATFATEPAVFAVLRDAVAAGALNVEWAQIFVRRAPAEQIVNAAHVWLADPTFWTAWESLPTVLLDRLRSMQPAPVSLRAAIVDGCGLDPVAGVRLYIRIADLLARLDEADGGDSATQLVERLLERVPRFAEDDRAFLETVIFDSGWRCLRIAALALPDLLQVARLFRKDESFALLYDEIDRRFRREPEGTTAALVKSGWWSFWRSRSRLSGSHPADAKALERGAREWLRSSRGDVTMEAWQLALRDLPNQLTGEDLARLRTDSADGAAWPLIAPFEQQQIEDLARRAADLGALAEIAEAVPGEGSRTLVESVLSRSPYASELPAEALACLIVLPNRRAAQLPVLPLRDSATLWKRAGHRRAQAMEARIRSVAAALHDTPVQALHAASSPSLWRNDDFRAELAQWLAGKRSAAAIGTEALGLIEREIEGAAEPRPAAPRELIASLVQQGRRRTAHFLDRDAAQRVQHDALATSALHALLQKRANDPCWQKLADSVRFAHKERALHPRQHPLRLLAAQIATAELAREDRATLFTDGWQTLEKVARQHKVLIAQPPFESHGFPIFDLAATMLGPGSIGVAAVRIRELADLLSRKDAAWWRRLLAGVRAFRRYGDVRCSDDREELALALLLDALTAAPDEHRALSAAMAAEAKTNAKWTPLAEFGMEAL
nr:hypothetical protein [Acidobacteriota bacterium]